MTQKFHFWIFIQRNSKQIWKDICSPMFIAALYTIAKLLINGWLKKEEVVHIYHGVLLSQKNNDILPFVTTRMDLEGIMLREVSQTQKDKYYTISLICGKLKVWNALWSQVDLSPTSIRWFFNKLLDLQASSSSPTKWALKQCIRHNVDIRIK